MKTFTAAAAIAVLALGSVGKADDEPQCRTFEEIYGSGEALCNNMWGDAFEYVNKNDPRYNLSYTMWFFSDDNPNDRVTEERIRLGLQNYTDTSVCHLNYFHHEKPKHEGNDFTECHPWENRACCSKDTVLSAAKLNEGYGDHYQWDRCGPLTPECERFFVQEACLYECDVNAGLFRKFHPHIYDEIEGEKNEWEMYKMPIKGEYCDAFYRACRENLFCAEDKGNIFSCALKYQAVDLKDDQEDDEGLSGGIIALIVILCVLVLTACVFVVKLVSRERAGDPVFKPIEIPSVSGSSYSAPQPEPTVAQT